MQSVIKPLPVHTSTPLPYCRLKVKYDTIQIETDASALYSAEKTRETIEQENGSTSAWVSKVNVGDGIL